MAETALVGDLGGTNARFALVRDGTLEDTHVLSSTGFTGLVEVIEAYLATVGREPPARAALAVASPVTGDRVDMTNLHWSFSISEVAARFGFRRLKVVNDFVAVALSIPELVPADSVAIGGGRPVDGQPVAVLGPGTGLGVSTLVPVADGWVPVPGEGGHVSLNAGDDREAAVIAHLRARYGHVSAERVLSGMGLVNLYEAVATVEGEQPEQLSPSEVTQAARAGSDRHCELALTLFFGFLGSVAGNLALTVGARGGVYLAGGILPRMTELLAASPFRRRFEEKGRLKDYLAAIPTRAIVHPLPAMLGLKSAAFDTPDD
jgi:glucokinase